MLFMPLFREASHLMPPPLVLFYDDDACFLIFIRRAIIYCRYHCRHICRFDEVPREPDAMLR